MRGILALNYRLAAQDVVCDFWPKRVYRICLVQLGTMMRFKLPTRVSPQSLHAPECDVTKADFRQYAYAAVKEAHPFAFHPRIRDAGHLRTARQLKRLSLKDSPASDDLAKFCKKADRDFRRSSGLGNITGCIYALQRYGSPAAMPITCSVCGKELHHIATPIDPNPNARSDRSFPSDSRLYRYIILLLMLLFCTSVAAIKFFVYK
jgi:hypothetical protein